MFQNDSPHVDNKKGFKIRAFGRRMLPWKPLTFRIVKLNISSSKFRADVVLLGRSPQATLKPVLVICRIPLLHLHTKTIAQALGLCI